MPRRPDVLSLLLLACALFLRAWVPAGWMPAPNKGAFAIELCPAAAPAMAMPHAGHHGSHKDQHDGDCSFAPHHSGVTEVASAAPLPAPMLAASALPENFAAPRFGTGPPSPPPPARGPPAIA